MNSRTILATAGVLIALATAAGAFGAHGLEGRLAPDRLAVYETAVRYQFWHALGLLAIGLAARFIDHASVRWAAGMILAGAILFSGSLYALSFGAPRILGAVAPFGGACLISGWLLFAIAALRG